MTEVVIIDNGGGNVASVRYARERLGCTTRVTRDPVRVRAAARVILPGVGAAVELVATSGGLLDFAALGGCRLLRRLRWPLLGQFEHDAEIEAGGFAATRALPGDVVYRKELRGAWARWPGALRPEVSARIVCR